MRIKSFLGNDISGQGRPNAFATAAAKRTTNAGFRVGNQVGIPAAGLASKIAVTHARWAQIPALAMLVHSLIALHTMFTGKHYQSGANSQEIRPPSTGKIMPALQTTIPPTTQLPIGYIRKCSRCGPRLRHHRHRRHCPHYHLFSRAGRIVPCDDQPADSQVGRRFFLAVPLNPHPEIR